MGHGPLVGLGVLGVGRNTLSNFVLIMIMIAFANFIKVILKRSTTIAREV